MVRMRRNFTLVELLVSLGVFSILLVLFMQFFSGMRLAWTNTEKRTDASYSARIAMDMVAALAGSMYYTNASTDIMDDAVQFPFLLKRAEAKSDAPAALYFASKTNIDLPGSNPIRFIGVQYATPDNDAAFKFNLSDERKELYALYLTVISNAEKDGEDKDISAKNSDIYHCFWPAPSFGDPKNTSQVIDADTALTRLEEILNGKLKPGSGETPEFIKLLDHVTEFKVTLLKADGNELHKDTARVTEVPYAIEVTLSVLSDADFETWLNTGKNKEFKLKNQMTFTRRIHIGKRWDMEEKYDEY